MQELLLSLGLIGSSLMLGYGIQQMERHGWLRLPVSLETLRKSLQKAALLFVLPVTIAGALWVVQLGSPALAALPLLGFCAIMLGGVLALLWARWMKMPAVQTGAFYPCGSFTNIGSFGALVCFLYLGENGFALVPIYKALEELTYYAIGFPIAKYHSADGGRLRTGRSKVITLVTDPFIIAAVSAMAIGAVLNLADIPRPAIFNRINTIFIPLGTCMLIVSIGLAMKFGRIKHYLKPCLAVSTIKFAVVPAVITTAAVLLGYGRMHDALPLKVVIILSSMPVAFNALIPPSIYDLDLDLANACWFFTTACLVWVLPVLLMVIRSF